MNMIHGFTPSLTQNIDHLMYADDFVLITKAVRLVARNIKFCLSIFYKLTGQKSRSKTVISLQVSFQNGLILSLLGVLVEPWTLTLPLILLLT